MSRRPAIDHALNGRAARGNTPDFAVGRALIQPSLNRISAGGQVTQVEPKVMQVLTLMAARPGAVVPRETFLEEIWPGAGDDYLLNRSVSELRKIFGDDVQSPRYIETIRKTGYRLIAPIAPARVAAAVSGTAAAAPPDSEPRGNGGPAEPAPVAGFYGRALSAARSALQAAPLLSGGLIAGAVGAVVIGLAIAATRSPPENGARIAERYDIRPLTSFVGREYEPALSPDGSRVAFIWDNGTGGTFDVYVKTVGSESVLSLTNSDGGESHPVWTPDGGAVLFVRSDQPREPGSSIMQVAALGGRATRVLRDEAAADIRGMSLAGDGTSLVYARRESVAAPYRIVLASLESGEKRIVTRPEPGTLGDVDPLIAPDGRSVHFVRGVNEVTKDLYTMSLESGETTRLTFDNRKINGLTWSPDGGKLLFTSTRSGMYGVWSVDAQGGELQAVPLGTEDVQQPSTVPGTGHVVYEQWTHRAQLRRIDLASEPGTVAANPVGSTRWDSNPAYGPDGERIAFTSNRAGPQGIWVSDRDGQNAAQVAGLGGAFVDHPAWSPDGALIAFDASPDGRTAVYTVAPDGGTPRQITNGPGDSRNPAWSRDGQWIYFESNRGGEWQIFALPAAGGDAVQVTAHGGVNPGESVDGEWLLYGKPDAPGLWRRPVRDWREAAAEDDEARLLEVLEVRDSPNWVPAAGGVYFVRRPETGSPVLALFDYASERVTEVAPLSASFEGWGLDLAPDGTEIVLAEVLMRESDLRLATPGR